MAKRHPRVTRGLGVSDEPPICMTVGNDQSISWMRHQPPSPCGARSDSNPDADRK